jgi:hypothetical protein
MYIFGSDGADQSSSTSRSWTPEHAWLLIKQLAQHDAIKYNELLLSDTYKTNGDAILRALEQAELITIVSGPNGRPALIKPGKPVYHPAFKRLTQDRVLAAKLDLQILNQLIKEENASIAKCEQELEVIAKLGGVARQMAGRVEWLLAKADGSQKKVGAWERESGGLKEVLKKEV